jgi:hypothetical protein
MDIIDLEFTSATPNPQFVSSLHRNRLMERLQRAAGKALKFGTGSAGFEAFKELEKRIGDVVMACELLQQRPMVWVPGPLEAYPFLAEPFNLEEARKQAADNWHEEVCYVGAKKVDDALSKLNNVWVAILPESPSFEEAQVKAGIGSPTSEKESAKLPGKNPLRRRMMLAAANSKAMELAKSDPAFMSKSTREWADDIGCSYGLVGKLDLWIQKQELTGHDSKQSKSPQTVSLTDQLLAVTSADEEQPLQRLIREQRADQEPSPLEPDSPDKPRRVHYRKKL